MNISSEIVVPTISAVSAIAVSWGMIKSTLRDLSKEIDSLVSWKEQYSREKEDRLRGIEKEMMELRGMMAVGNEQYKEILRRLTIIEIKMEERRNIFKDLDKSGRE